MFIKYLKVIIIIIIINNVIKMTGCYISNKVNIEKTLLFCKALIYPRINKKTISPNLSKHINK